ncbi:hypothetical protein [Methanolobus psychrotolerans]|uniref:hypothetical protein n=1 Tax=Methanolobus psychrotolerans TaxID=1874706 RepID=UPI00101AE76B|nr:hypothetical protein [Methanolobus psychrotolerans]
MSAIPINPNFFNHDAQAGGFFPVTHINPGFDIEAFISGTGKNILVEGIRGTGKTHILKMISSKCIDTYPEKKILPVYISLARVSEWEGSDIRLFRIQLYASIVAEAISTLERERSRISYQKNGFEKSVDAIKRMFGIRTEDDIDTLLQKIKDINERLLGSLAYNPEKILERISSGSEQNAGVTVGAPHIQASLSDVRRQIEDKEIQLVGKNLAHESAAPFIIEFFKQLKEILGCNYTILLLDECSEASTDAQVELFRLLKLIRGAFTANMQTNNVYFIASVYPPYATEYPSRLRGHSFNFDPGQDAGVEYLQLDELADEYETFFHELTRKRLQYIFERMISDPITEIFENERAFYLAVYGANGIPRRYLEILKQSYDNLCQRTGSEAEIKKISQKDVESGIQTVASGQILSPSKLQNDDFKIIEEISKRIGTRNKKTETENKDKQNPIPANVYFTINRSQVEEITSLLLQGCVHDKGRTRLRKYYKDEGAHGPLFMLDLALAIYNGAIDKRRILDILRNDLKENAKSGYLYCQDFNLDQFEYRKK